MSIVVGAVHKGCISTFYEAVDETAAKQLAERLMTGEVQADIDSPITRTWVLSEVEADNVRKLGAAMSDYLGGN